MCSCVCARARTDIGCFFSATPRSKLAFSCLFVSLCEATSFEGCEACAAAPRAPESRHQPLLRMQQADATRSRIQRALERPKGSNLNNDGANRCFSGDLAACFFSLCLLNQVPTTDQRGASSSHQVQADGAIPLFFWVGRDCKTFRELCQHAIHRDFELLCISSTVLSTCYGRKESAPPIS